MRPPHLPPARGVVVECVHAALEADRGQRPVH